VSAGSAVLRWWIAVSATIRTAMRMRGLEEAMLLHDDCPCPVHGWDADRQRLYD
jgi:hypothetical protein